MASHHHNAVSIAPQAFPSRPVFSDLAAGQVFQFCDPHGDNIYMRTDTQGQRDFNAIHLNTGHLYFIQPHRSIVPLSDGQTVTLRNNR